MLLVINLLLAGCESGFDRIDRRVEALLAESSDDLSGGAIAPALRDRRRESPPPTNAKPTDTKLPTTNPGAEELDFTAIDPTPEELTERLDAYEIELRQAIHLNLEGSLGYAIMNSREYRFAEEEYILSALRVLIERHRWGPRFFNEMSALVTADGDDGMFESALRLVNEFGVTQRLPYGGQVSARALATATENLHRRVAGQNVQAAEIIVDADIPLLRGAGDIAREDRIQTERELVYAARTFERFRREFLVSIATEYLDLIVRQQNMENARRQLESLEWMEERSRALVAVGLETPIDLALAEQATLFARDTLNSQMEAYRLAVDRFKVRLGMPEDQPLVIEPDQLGLPTPDVSLEQATATAMRYRLDLQSRHDQLDDARRNIKNAKNLLLPDLDLFGRVAVPTNPRRDRGGADFSPGDTSFEAGITFGLPLDREIERINVRQAQIQLERAIREFNRFRDSIAIEIRGTVRDIDRARFSLEIQRENVLIAEKGLEAIEAAPDRATARDRTEAVDRLLRAQDQLDVARRDLQVAILRYLLDSGQLRVKSDGTIQPLQNMEIVQPAQPDPIPVLDGT